MCIDVACNVYTIEKSRRYRRDFFIFLLHFLCQKEKRLSLHTLTHLTKRIEELKAERE